MQPQRCRTLRTRYGRTLCVSVLATWTARTFCTLVWLTRKLFASIEDAIGRRALIMACCSLEQASLSI